MTYRDLLDAEYGLYGDYGRHLSIRKTPGGQARYNDLAQAWLDGKHEVVQEAIASYKSRIDIVTVVDRIRELRRAGWMTIDISRQLRVSAGYIARVCRNLPTPIRSRGKKNTARVVILRNQGLTQRKIAAELGLSLRTVQRVLKKSRHPLRLNKWITSRSAQRSVDSSPTSKPLTETALVGAETSSESSTPTV